MQLFDIFEDIINFIFFIILIPSLRVKDIYFYQ